MRIVTKRAYNYLKSQLKVETWQEYFPEVTKCVRCRKPATIILLLNDDEGLICEQEIDRNLYKIWPHDCCAIALYMCPECGEITALWNQA